MILTIESIFVILLALILVKSQGGFEKKEAIIKRVAKDEFEKGNITKECYDVMLRYEIGIDD